MMTKLRKKIFYLLALVPAVFMSAVVTSYILIAPEGFSLSTGFSYAAGIIVALSLLIFTMLYIFRLKHKSLKLSQESL